MDKKISSDSQRVAKVMARLGICSRRQAEVLIQEKKVRINGQILTTLGYKLLPEDVLMVDRKTYQWQQQEKTRLWRYYKPMGLICSQNDPQGRPTIFDDIKQRYPHLPYLVSVGRLDFNSEGLLLLTNDGVYARQLELPSQKHIRIYRVRVRGRFNPEKLLLLDKGITVDGIHYAPIKAEIENVQSSNTWLIMELTEGKNREIRNIMDFFGHPVSRLIRLAYGKVQLAGLKPYQLEEVSKP